MLLPGSSCPAPLVTMLSSPKPIPFITEDPRRPSHFVVDPAAATLLRAIKGPICPVVVAGPYRSGKSTLLNLLLPPTISRHAGFAVGSSIQACTKGIWLWGEPIKVDGRTILLLDSEGLGSIGKEQTFDVQIFSLSILLASMFLLNTSGTINEGALEQLELVVQMTERVRAKDSRAGGSGSSGSASSKDDELHALAAHFPDFLWVLRDFSLELQDSNGFPISARQFLEQALQPVAGSRSTEKNRIRHVLSTVFPSRDCVPLVRPITDERQLQRMQSLDVKELRAEFRTQMDALRERVRTQVRPKTVEGVTVTGSAYLSLAEAYVRAINGGTVPVIHSAWTAVVELQAKKAMEEARTSFHSDLKELSTSLHSSTELTKALEMASMKAQQLLSEHAVGDMELLDALRKQLSDWVRDESERVRELNGTKSREHNQRVWSDVWKRAKGDSVVEEADDETAWTELEARVLSEYNNQARGEGRDEVVRERLAERRERMMARVMQRRAEERRQLTELQKSVAAKDKRVAELEKQVAKLDVELESERRTRGDEKRRAEEVEKRAEEDKRRLERQLTEVKEQWKELQDEGKSRRKELQDSQSRMVALDAEVKASETEVRRLKEEVREASVRERRAEGGSKDRQTELDRAHSDLNKEKKEAERLTEQCRQLNEQLSSLRGDHSQVSVQTRELAKHLGQKGEELMEEKEKRRKAEAELRRVRNEDVAQLEHTVTQLKEERRDALDRERQAEEKTRKHEAELRTVRENVPRMEEAVKQSEETAQQIRQLKAELRDALDKQRQAEELTSKRDEELTRVKAELHSQSTTSSTGARQQSYDEQREEKQREAARGGKKRKLQDTAEEKDVDMEADPPISPPASPPSTTSSFLPPPPRPSIAASRRSLAPTRLSVDGGSSASGEPANPNELTVPQLKSWLTELDVELPVRALKKDEYVDMVYNAMPELNDTFPRQVTAGKKAKKPR